jgi:hypothetical protein
MGVDLEKKRLFVVATGNNSLEVVDLTGGKVFKSLAGFKDTQDALFLGGDFNNLTAHSSPLPAAALFVRRGSAPLLRPQGRDTEIDSEEFSG